MNDSKMYNKPFYMNACTIFMYKSSRINAAITGHFHFNHLITQTDDRKVSDECIIRQFVELIEKVVCSAGKSGHLELSVYMDAGKNVVFENYNNELYHCIEDVQYNWNRVKFYSIEECINFLFSVFCIMYPYNEISKENGIYRDPSIKYWIKKYYEMEV